MYKIFNEVIKFIEPTMKNISVKLKVGGKCLTEVKIQGETFRVDVVFAKNEKELEILIQGEGIYSHPIETFDIGECTMLIRKSRK